MKFTSVSEVQKLVTYLLAQLSSALHPFVFINRMSAFCFHHLNTRLQLTDGTATMADPSAASQAASPPSASASRLRYSSASSKASRSCAHLSTHTLKQLKFVLPGGVVTYFLGTLARFWRLVESHGWAKYVYFSPSSQVEVVY